MKVVLDRCLRPAVAVALALSLVNVDTPAASASHVQTPAPLPVVASLDASTIDLGSFDGREQAVAPYLALLAPLANSVVDHDADTYGWISAGFWRTDESFPVNARVMENILTMAYFYSVDRPWNPYRGDAALRARLEAAVGYWADLQNPDGSFPESYGYTSSRPATAFALDFVSASTLEVLELGPGIDPQVHDRLVAASEKAATWFLTDDEVWGQQGQILSNQVISGMVGISRLVHRFPHLRDAFEARVSFMAANMQSPTGGYFYEGGAGHAYSLLVASDDLALWGDDATRPTILAMQRSYVDWMQYNFLHDEGLGGYLSNTALDTRHGRTFNDAVAPGVGANGLWASDVPEAAAYAASAEQVAARLETFRRGTWETVVQPEIHRVRRFMEPRPIRNVLAAEHHPSQADKDAATASLRYRAQREFTEYRADTKVQQQFLFARRAPYLVGLSFGRQPVIPAADATLGRAKVWDRVRYGLNYLWSPAAGMVVQSQNALHLGDPRGDGSYQGLEWATVARDGDGAGYEVDAYDHLVPAFSVEGAATNPERLPSGGDLRVSYSAVGGGDVRKTVDVSSDHLEVAVRTAGSFWEQVPLVLAPDDELSWIGAESAPAFGQTGQRILAEGLVIDRSGHRIAIRWDGERLVELDGVDPVACLCGLVEREGLYDANRHDAVGQRRLHLLKIHADDSLRYAFRFGSTAASEPAPEPLPVCEPDGALSTAFSDVPSESVHLASIDCAVQLGLAQGLDGQHYGPARTVSRGQMASFVVRLLAAVGSPAPVATTSLFTDTLGTAHGSAIESLAAAGLVSGDGSGAFHASAPVTRAQMATMLVEAYAFATGSELPVGDAVFTDVAGSPHADNIRRAASAGIASGVGDGRYDPSGQARRDQMATLLVGAYETVAALP